jgi:tRNA-modifying protein YgfZ
VLTLGAVQINWGIAAVKNYVKLRMITGRDNQTMQDAMKFNIDVSVSLNAPTGPLGVIRVQGADAVKFLQGQLTQDVALLGLSEARLAAWCSAKGRMLASFVVLKNTQDDILLLCSASVLPATLKRLQMFVLRAQCKLLDATALFDVQGLTGQKVTHLSINTINSIATQSINTWTISRNDAQITVQLPAGMHAGVDVRRALCITPTDAPAAVPADASALAVWSYLEVTTGIAHITAPIADAFVPQMLNYESVGGVNFKKGCYPGQEVVARSQFRGTLKRRGYIVSSTQPLAAGQEIFDSRDADQPCGLVASAAPLPAPRPTEDTAGWLAVVSMQTGAASSPRLALGAADGPQLVLQALPYALLEDI